MKSKRPLSVIPYFGGKSKMSSFLAERFDYSVSTFVTLFGGGCRELLNKPPHAKEIYNEYDTGLCVLIETLANPDTAQQLIDKLYYETEPTEEQFQQAKKIYDLRKYDLEETLRKSLKQFLFEHTKKDKRKLDTQLEDGYQIIYDKVKIKKDGLSKIYISDADTVLKLKKRPYNLDIGKRRIINRRTKNIEKNLFSVELGTDKFFEFHQLFTNWLTTKHIKMTEGLMRYDDMFSENEISDLDLAAATYLTYTLSFSGIGSEVGRDKFKTDESYRKRILFLYECADRLNGVEVTQLDAMSFFKQRLYEMDIDNLIEELVNKKEELENNKELSDEQKNEIEIAVEELEFSIQYLSKNVFYNWLNNPDVCMYLDPSYLSAVDESERDSKKAKQNLGKRYPRSSDYEEHRAILEGIQNAKCKLMISNYDSPLYNEYLTPEKGWYKEVYSTKTTVSNNSKFDKSKERIEVIWRNY